MFAINWHAINRGARSLPKKAHFESDKIKIVWGCTWPPPQRGADLCATRGGVTVRSFEHRAGRGAALLGSALICLCSTAAVAQWNPHFTASMGRGYGSIALSQSILSGTRRLGAGATVRPNAAPRARAASLTPAQIDAALTYTMGGQTPATREQMTKAFADDVVLKEFDRVMSANGYSSRNVADDMAALLVLCWEIFTGGSANKLQIEGARQQSRGIFLGTPALRTMTNAERQEMAERIAYQFVISDMANQLALRSGDQAQRAQVRQSAAAVMRQRVNFFFTETAPTEKGFSKKS